jgi:hypothetical protein
MKMPISPTAHGAIDYSTVAATMAAPSLLKFPKKAATAAYLLGGGYLALSALTDYPPAVKREVPLRAHGAADAVMGLAIPAIPWVLGFAGDRKARNFFLALTGVTMAVTAMTDWKANDRRSGLRRFLPV